MIHASSLPRRKLTIAGRWILVPLLLWLGSCDGSHTQDHVTVTKKIDGIEVFERIVLGRGLRADWATTKLALLNSDDLAIHIIAGSYASEAGDLVPEAEDIAQKILNTALMTTGRKIRGLITTERVDDLDAACTSFLKSKANANERNVILVVLGTEAQRCIATAEQEPFSLTQLRADVNLDDEQRLDCASRLRAATQHDGKMTVIAASPKGNEHDIPLLRFCLYDRSFSFFGMRGRLFYESVALEDTVRSLRTGPRHAIVPSTVDALTMAVAYRHLADGSDYMTVRDKIKKSIGKLQP